MCMRKVAASGDSRMICRRCFSRGGLRQDGLQGHSIWPRQLQGRPSPSGRCCIGCTSCRATMQAAKKPDGTCACVPYFLDGPCKDMKCKDGWLATVNNETDVSYHSPPERARGAADSSQVPTFRAAAEVSGRPKDWLTPWAPPGAARFAAEV